MYIQKYNAYLALLISTSVNQFIYYLFSVPPVPLENHCAHQHCEQRINLNAHQSLMVINNNEAPFGMPEIQLVDLNRERPLECCLKHLSFRGYDRVSDLTLTNIQNLHLELLDVTYTRCTRKGVLDFLKTNPNCRVLHKEFCVCLPKLDFQYVENL